MIKSFLLLKKIVKELKHDKRILYFDTLKTELEEIVDFLSSNFELMKITKRHRKIIHIRCYRKENCLLELRDIRFN